MIPTVVISARGEERLRGGHPWIYRADVADARAAAGDIVQVRSPRGQTLGSALTGLLHPRGILARNDPRARLLDGLEQRVDVLAGEVPESVTITETGVRYDVDLRHGQKTGLFLDQRENRAAGAAYARGRMLDCFSYNGGFALVLGRRCDETIAFDVSDDAVARVRQNAARNGVAVDARVGN